MSVMSEARERLERARALLLEDVAKIDQALELLGGVRPGEVTMASTVQAPTTGRQIESMVRAILTDGEPHTTRAILHTLPDYPESTVIGVLGKMVDEGHATRISRGVYQSPAAVFFNTDEELDL